LHLLGRRRFAAVLASCLIAASAPAAFAAAPAAARTSGAQVGFWASQNFQPCAAGDPAYCPRDTSVYTPEVWDALASTHGALYINMVYTSDFGPTPAGVSPRTDGLDLIRQANRLGIPVSAWITAPVASGTFANENNAAVMGNAVRAFHDWSQQQRVRLHEVALDLEFPLGYQAVADAVAGDPSGLVSLMRANIDPAHQCQATSSYRETIAWAHAHGMRITGTPITFAIDDLADGNLALQDALDVAPGPPPGYDEVYVQAYRSYSNPSSGYVASYFKSMRQYFGSRGQVSLGGTGQPPYDKVGNLVNDVRMLAGLGAKTIPIFDLDGTVKTFGAAGLRAVIEAGRNPLTGAELAAATAETAYDQLNRQFFRNLDVVASDLTLAVTTSQGHPRQPNTYPTSC
jgi:hypothetical protein